MMRRQNLAQPRTAGIIQIVASGMGFGLLGIFGKAAFAAGVTAGENLSLRFLISSALLFLYLAVFDRPALRLGRRTVARCALLGVLGYAVFSSCYFAALEGLSASLTVLLLYTYPVIVAVLARVVLKQRLTRRNAAALPLVMVGLVCLVSADLSAKNPVYIGYGLASAALYSVYILVSSRVLSASSPIASVAAIQAFAGLALAALHLHDPERVGVIVRGTWPLLVAMSVFCTAMPMVLFISGLQKLSSAEVSLLSTTEPVTGVALATILLHEQLTPLQWLGAAVIIAALVYMAGAKRSTVSVAAAVLALFAFAPDASAKPPSKKKQEKAHKSLLLAPAAEPEDRSGDKIGLLFAAGYEAVDYQGADPAVSIDGFAGAVLGTYEVGFGRFAALELGAGLHYDALSGANDVATLDLATVSLLAEAVPAVIIADAYEIGALAYYGYGIAGSTQFKVKGAGSSDHSLTSSSHLGLGARFMYHVDPYKALGADVSALSGGYAVKSEKVKFSGRSVRLLFNYFF